MEGLFLSFFPSWLVYGAAITVGLLCGSFLNVVIYRLPRGLSLIHPGSRCPHCDTPIAPYHNLPVLGWLALRGRSHCCKQPINPRYPVIELLGGMLAGAIVTMKLEPLEDELSVSRAALIFLLYLSFSLALVAAAAIDFEHMILPDSLTWGGMVLGLASSPVRLEVDLTMSVIGAFAGFIGLWFPFIWLHEKLRGFAGMGLGDAKLMAMAGAWFGPLGALFTLFLGALQGTLFTIAAFVTTGNVEDPELIARQKKEMLDAIDKAEGEERELLKQEYESDPLFASPDGKTIGPRVAFGPFLALSMIELMLFFEPFSEWLDALFFF